MSRVTNYYNLGLGETFDLLIMDYQEGFPNGKLIFNISQEPRKVTGLQKVVQTFLYYLLTRKGTDLLYPNKGTYFTEFSMYSNRTGTVQQVQSTLGPEIEDAASQAKTSLNAANTDAVSLLDKVEILMMDVNEDRTELYLQITTKAGTTASVSVPFPETNLPING